jgi:hypothetical protein
MKSTALLKSRSLGSRASAKFCFHSVTILWLRLVIAVVEPANYGNCGENDLVQADY